MSDDARWHQALAAMYESLGDDGSAKVCRDYATRIVALEGASDAEKNAAAQSLRDFREFWRSIREVTGSTAVKVDREAVVVPPAVKKHWWRRAS